MFRQIIYSIMRLDEQQEYFEETFVKLCSVQCIELLIFVVKRLRMIRNFAKDNLIKSVDKVNNPVYLFPECLLIKL